MLVGSGPVPVAWSPWIVLAMAAAGAAVGGLVWRAVVRPAEVRALRHALGQCQRCGYLLTGNVSGVCPECGVERRPV